LAFGALPWGKPWFPQAAPFFLFVWGNFPVPQRPLRSFTTPRVVRRERIPRRRHGAAGRHRAAPRRGVPAAADRRPRRPRDERRGGNPRAALSLGRSERVDLLHGGRDRGGRVLDRRPRVRPLPGPLDLMHASDLAVDVLLALGVAAELLCVAGVV